MAGTHFDDQPDRIEHGRRQLAIDLDADRMETSLLVWPAAHLDSDCHYQPVADSLALEIHAIFSGKKPLLLWLQNGRESLGHNVP